MDDIKTIDLSVILIVLQMIPNNMKRLQKQKEFWDKTPPPGMRGRPKNAQLTDWEFVIRGPNGTPYAHLYFTLRAQIPLDYPASAPSMRFQTIIFHPNVSEITGNICIDVLKKQWKPGNTLAMVLNSINGLMMEPFPNDPLNGKARDLYNKSQPQYKKKARQEAMAKGSFNPPAWFKS